MELTISIISMNEAEDLKRCLQHLGPSLNETDCEIFVTDNASTDGTSDIVRQAFPQIKLIRNNTAKGFCENHNVAIRRSTGRNVLILNADVFIEKGFIERLIRTIDSDAKIGCVMGKLLWGGDASRKTIDSMGLRIFRDRRTADIGQGDQDRGQYDALSEIFSASGSAMLCKREMLDDVKLGNEYFDESFVAYKEELDLCWRARLKGWKIVCDPQAVAVHMRGWGKGVRRASIPRFVRRHSFKNRYLMLIKDEYPVNYLRDMSFILWHEIKAMIYLILREPHLILAVFQVISLLPQTFKKRAQIMSGAKVPAGDIRKWFK